VSTISAVDAESGSLKTVWYSRRGSAVILGLLSLMLIYPIVLRALDTGSLQQYFLALVLLIFGINRLVYVVKWRKV